MQVCDSAVRRSVGALPITAALAAAVFGLLGVYALPSVALAAGPASVATDADGPDDDEVDRQTMVLAVNIPGLEGCYVPFVEGADGQPKITGDPTLEYQLGPDSTYSASVDGVASGKAFFTPVLVMRYFAESATGTTQRAVGSSVEFKSPAMMKAYMRTGLDRDVRNPAYSQVQIHFAGQQPKLGSAKSRSEAVGFDFIQGVYSPPGLLFFATVDLTSAAVSSVAAISA
jgi:hypothetical protein